MAAQLPHMREAFKQTHLNIWGDGSAAGWIDMAIYDEAKPRERDLEGETCYIGVDLSKSYDLSAIEAAFPDDDGGFDLLSFAFLPETAFRRRRKELPDVPWDRWREEGALTIIPGDVIDDNVIADKLRELCVMYDVREIAYDPKYAAKLMAELFAEDLPVVGCPPTPLMVTPFYAELQKLILARKLRHGGHPVLRWCVQNAVPVTTDTGLFYIGKKRSIDAVDCLSAAAMAIGRAGNSNISIYDDVAERPTGFLFI